MNLDFVPAIFYIDLNDFNRPKSFFWYPTHIPEEFRKLIEIKCSDILSTDQAFIPEILLIYPFKNLKTKILIKYFERNNSKKQATTKSAITFLFKEEDDIIFYRYLSYIDKFFTETIQKIIEYEENNMDNHMTFQEITKLRNTLNETVDYLRSKSNIIIKNETKPESDEDIEEEPIEKFKVIVLGDPSVGKTSTILKFTDNVFMRAYIPTMGLNITKKRFFVQNKSVELIFWDIGGQKKFETIRKQFYEGASAFLLVFDISNPGSFANVPKWYQDLKNHLLNPSRIDGYLVGNKIDLTKNRIVNPIDAIRLAKALNIQYFEISALTGVNIEEAFSKLSFNLIKSQN
ncbi:MAG: Rab family GTPase [Promethearchaeota archaeon]